MGVHSRNGLRQKAKSEGGLATRSSFHKTTFRIATARLSHDGMASGNDRPAGEILLVARDVTKTPTRLARMLRNLAIDASEVTAWLFQPANNGIFY